MELNSRKFALYIISILVLSGVGILAYDLFGFNKFHTSDVKIFCDPTIENVGVKNTRSLDMLKLYLNEREKFENSEAFKIENFKKDTIHIPNCTPAVLFSKRYNGARGVKVMRGEEEIVVTLLTENITFLDE